MAYKYNIDPSSTREEKIARVQDGTMNDIMNMLNSHQIALMVRPTGFGKTYTMIKLTKEEKYEKVLYMYPMGVIKQSIEDDYHKCDENGKPIPPYIEDGKEKGIRYAATEEEHLAFPDLPYIEFCTYDKMLEDYNNVYRFSGNKPWAKLSKDERTKIEQEWNKLDKESQKKRQLKWLKDRFDPIELLVLDEAHMTGANGFMEYWPGIHKLSQDGLKRNRLHVLGATATPSRTSEDINIEEEIFYYTRGKEKYSARITDFTLEDCWKFGILQRPYYVKGILDKNNEKDLLLAKLQEEQGKKLKDSGYTLSEIEEELDYQFSLVKSPHLLIKSAMEEVDIDTLNNKNYMRFLVFYQESNELAKYHEQINEAIRLAFPNYTSINPYYIISSDENIKDKSAISVSSVNVLSEIDESIRRNPDTGSCRIDIIHSIKMLNMGYHVGKVTGVIIKRATGSEIVYYQQIGRGISIRANNKPLIIDFDNADAELTTRALNTERAEAVNNIDTFINGCDTDKKQNEAVNGIYKQVNMYLDNTPIDINLLDFWYFDRFSPIYFIYGISKSLGKKESLEMIMEKLDALCSKVRYEFVIDNDFCMDNGRIHKNVFTAIINKEPTILVKIRKK